MCVHERVWEKLLTTTSNQSLQIRFVREFPSCQYFASIYGISSRPLSSGDMLSISFKIRYKRTHIAQGHEAHSTALRCLHAEQHMYTRIGISSNSSSIHESIACSVRVVKWLSIACIFDYRRRQMCHDSVWHYSQHAYRCIDNIYTALILHLLIAFVGLWKC